MPTRFVIPFAAVALALVSGLALGATRPASGETATRPSFVLIQTDDQTLASLNQMPNTIALLAGRGMSFGNYYVSYPLCCPSRVSLLTGRYAHNHDVRGNVPPEGGFTGFASRAAWSHNLATWLREAGYRTIHIGKVLNGYGDAPYDDGTSVPPGWDAWHSVVESESTHYYYGYRLNDNGEIQAPLGDPGSWETREYGVRDDPSCVLGLIGTPPCNYITDHLTDVAAAEILGTPSDRPFYLQLDYTSPHGDYRRPAGPEPAPRNNELFRGIPLPHDRTAGLDEDNVSDKPRFIRDAPRLTAEDERSYGVYYQKQLEALSSVDEGVMRLIQTLGRVHRVRNTYVIFVSDNGFFFGEHRLLGGKFLAYEPATHLPLLIRGPGVRPGTISNDLAANVDIAPTVLELAGARADRSLDGRSLVPELHGRVDRRSRPILFESFVETSDVEAQGEPATLRDGGATASLLAPPKNYTGIRIANYKFIAWPTGEYELYDLDRDPYELHSLHRVPNFAPIRKFLHRQMLRLRRCAGRECREAMPKLPLTRNEALRRRKRNSHDTGLPGGPGVGAIAGRDNS